MTAPDKEKTYKAVKAVKKAIKFLDQHGPENWRKRVAKPVDIASSRFDVLSQISFTDGKEFTGAVQDLGIYENQDLCHAFGYGTMTASGERMVNAVWNKFLGFAQR